jgi:multiple sugar transport system substrate-binding protein
MKRALSVFLTCGILLTSFSGCSGAGGTNSTQANPASPAASTASTTGEAKTIRVAWWGNQVRNDRTAKVLKMYEKANPGVTFETEFTDWSGYWDKMATQAASDSMPDIIQMDYAYINQYQSKNQLVDLTSYVGKELDLTDASKDMVASGTIDNKLYGVALGITSPAMVYDVEAVKKAGVTIKDNMTMSEFIAAAKQIKEKTGQTCDYCYPNGEAYMEYLVRGQGQVLFQDGKLGIDNSSAVLPFFQAFETGVKEGYVASAEQLDAAVGTSIEQSPLINGKEWMTLTTSNQLSAFSSAAKKTLGITTWPVGDKDVQKAMWFKPASYFCVTPSSKNQQECAKVINFFTNSVEANEILLTDRGAPICSKVRAGVKSKLDASSQQFLDFITKAEAYTSKTNPPSPSGMTEVATMVHNLTEQVVYNKLTAQQAADQFFTQANEILAKAAKK